MQLNQTCFFMKTLRGSLLPTVCAVLIVTRSTLFANPGERTAPSKPSVPAAGGQSAQNPGYDLVIADGLLKSSGTNSAATLVNVVDALRDLYPGANIVLSPNLRDSAVQDLKLRSARIEDALEALRVASDNAF